MQFMYHNHYQPQPPLNNTCTHPTPVTNQPIKYKSHYNSLQQQYRPRSHVTNMQVNRNPQGNMPTLHRQTKSNTQSLYNRNHQQQSTPLQLTPQNKTHKKQIKFNHHYRTTNKLPYTLKYNAHSSSKTLHNLEQPYIHPGIYSTTAKYPTFTKPQTQQTIANKPRCAYLNLIHRPTNKSHKSFSRRNSIYKPQTYETALSKPLEPWRLNIERSSIFKVNHITHKTILRKSMARTLNASYEIIKRKLTTNSTPLQMCNACNLNIQTAKTLPTQQSSENLQLTRNLKSRQLLTEQPIININHEVTTQEYCAFNHKQTTDPITKVNRAPRITQLTKANAHQHHVKHISSGTSAATPNTPQSSNPMLCNMNISTKVHNIKYDYKLQPINGNANKSLIPENLYSITQPITSTHNLKSIIAANCTCHQLIIKTTHDRLFKEAKQTYSPKTTTVHTSNTHQHITTSKSAFHVDHHQSTHPGCKHLQD
eukprot:gene3127-2109_t